ncbi:MAG: hypothetical protein ACYC0F_10250 [Rhodanobacter sp.]
MATSSIEGYRCGIRDSAVAISSSITGRRKGVPAIDSTGVLA